MGGNREISLRLVSLGGVPVTQVSLSAVKHRRRAEQDLSRTRAQAEGLSDCDRRARLGQTPVSTFDSRCPDTGIYCFDVSAPESSPFVQLYQIKG